ncbi:unnamed protein product [Linum trigynum]|uniref:CCHC-type domain-containing protein n=1 Tax=Linum trigynum TaxID=586398 RepID=A0AAV2FAR8_9ROSI
MRGALPSLLAWSCWLGNWLLEIFSSFFLISLVNQNAGKAQRGHDLDRGNGSENGTRWKMGSVPRLHCDPNQMGCNLKRVLKKRKQVLSREMQDFSIENDPSISISVKKRRLVQFHEWRFCLPSSDLVGEEPLLSRTDEINVESSDLGERANARVGLGDRDFVAEAASMRGLVINRRRRCAPVVAAGGSADAPPCLATRDLPPPPPPQSENLGKQLAISPGMDFPAFSGLFGGSTRITAQRKDSSEDTLLVGNFTPIRTLTIPNMYLQLGFSGGRGPLSLFILRPNGRWTVSTQKSRRPGEIASTETLSIFAPLRSSSGMWRVWNPQSIPVSFRATPFKHTPVIHPCPKPAVHGKLLTDEVLGWKIPGANTINKSLCQDLCTMAHVTEDQVVHFSLEEVQSTRFRAARSLLGHLFTNDQITTGELREELLDAWKIRGQLRVIRAKHGLFEIVLPNEEAKKWALSRNPWIIKDRLLTLCPWSPVIPKKNYEEMAKAPLRVQLWGVKEDCCTKLFGRKMVVAAIGQVIDAGIFACKETGERFIKVNTVIDFSLPLRSQIMAASEEGDKFWVSCKYEFLPSFCFRCGRIGHARRDCSFDPPQGQERFGPHMATKKVGRKLYEEEGDSPVFGGSRRSVWINRQQRIPMAMDSAEPTRESQNLAQSAARMKQTASSKIMMAEVSIDEPAVQQMQISGRPTQKPRGSPRGFVVNRPPKVRLGQNRPSKSGRKVSGTAPGNPKIERRTVIASAQSRPRSSAQVQSEPPSNEETPAMIQEHSRRRRLLLEEDSDDDMVDVTPMDNQGISDRPVNWNQLGRWRPAWFRGIRKR